MRNRPSETERGVAWVNNFPPEDKRAAELLLNSLRVLSDVTFRATLTNLLASLVRELPHPIGIYQVRELPNPDVEGFLPLAHPHAPLPGSEGAVGHIIRDVIGSRPDGTVASSPQTLEDLRRIKARTLVLVDDYSGTGNRVAGYLDAWVRDPTMRSWFSYKLIKFHVVLHAVSVPALRALERSPWVERVHFSEHAVEFSTARWSTDEAAEIRELCTNHGFKKKLALGYQEAEGLWVMQHTVPNNLPMILWQDRHKSNSAWRPFFADRKMSPEQQQELGDYRLETRAEEIAGSLRQPRLSHALTDQPGATTRLLLLVLAAAARGVRDVRRLSLLFSTPLASAEAAQQACIQLGLLDSVGRLTHEGQRELVSARRRAPLSVPTRHLIGRDKPYYPWQLRGVEDI
ncbi:hypothetical protein [Streptomyces sp. NPDC059949]|uniref:phosphoribosyltransferase-like protein n=1 Tax=Streptomyces sp. NPDC059949 TaxID=3347013 RepID=UPI00365800A6